MQRLRWFLIGIALTAFSADYLRMKTHWQQMESDVLKSVLTLSKVQDTGTSCLIELAYNRSLIESWTAKKRISALAQVEILQSLDRAREGDPEALSVLGDLGYSIAKPTNRLVASAPPINGKGVGGY